MRMWLMVVLGLGLCAQAAAADVLIDDTDVYPESMSAAMAYIRPAMAYHRSCR